MNFKYLSWILLLPFTLFADLETIIKPEIRDDAFAHAIYEFARTEDIKTILEIGSSSGDGSTASFVRGILENPHHPMLYCIEMSNTRFVLLQKRYKNNPYVKCYRVCTVRLEDYPTYDHDWLRPEIEYLKTSGVQQDGIRLIMKENHLAGFDMVLIDGSEFTGEAECKIIYGAKIIMLDDIRSYKNQTNYATLLKDPNYQLVQEDQNLRNGYAIFKRRD